MKKYNIILTEKQQKSDLSSGKVDNYEYFTAEEILPSDQEQANFTYFPLGKAFEKKKKNRNNWRTMKKNKLKL